MTSQCRLFTRDVLFTVWDSLSCCFTEIKCLLITYSHTQLLSCALLSNEYLHATVFKNWGNWWLAFRVTIRWSLLWIPTAVVSAAAYCSPFSYTVALCCVKTPLLPCLKRSSVLCTWLTRNFFLQSESEEWFVVEPWPCTLLTAWIHSVFITTFCSFWCEGYILVK